MITVFAEKKTRDLEVSPRFDIGEERLTIHRSLSIATGRFPVCKLGRSVGLSIGRLLGRSVVGRLVHVRERNYRFPTVINLRALLLEITVVRARNVLISMLMARAIGYIFLS